MKDIKLKKSDDTFSAILKIGSHNYILSNKLMYDLQVVDLEDTIAKCCAKKYGLRMDRSHSVKVDFDYNSDTFDIDTTEWRDDACGYGRTYSSGNKISDVVNICDLLSNMDMILIDKASTEFCIVLNRYKLNPEEFENEILLSPEFVEKLTIQSDEAGLCYSIQEKSVGMEELQAFFNQSIYSKDALVSLLIEAAFNCHIRRPGIHDVYFPFKGILRRRGLQEYSRMTDMEILSCYEDISSQEFYLLAEYYIKNDMEAGKILGELPTLTGKPFKNPKDMDTVSKKTMEFLKKNQRTVDLRRLSIFSKMESDPKIGVNNVHLLIDFFDMLEAAGNKVKESSWDSSFNFFVDNAATVNEILDSFECSMKNLIEKAVRAIFYYNMNPNNYFTTIMDYHRMCQELGVDPGKKIPADVIARHDNLSLMVRDIREKKVLEQFKKQAQENKKLIMHLPLDERYTMLAPEEPSDLVNEGNALNHCVGSYGRRVASGNSKIFFLRRKSNESIPYVTIELNANNTLMQSRAFSNADPSREDLQYIYSWLDMIGGSYDK